MHAGIRNIIFASINIEVMPLKTDCTYTRRSLPKYLRGHLFKYEQIRIARHLNACPVCRSEFQAMKKVADTKQLLKDITPPEGVVQKLKAGASGLRRLKLLIYRPLWLLLIVGAGTLLFVNILQNQRDIEIENIEKSLPSEASAPTATPGTALQPTVQQPVLQTAGTKTHEAAPSPRIAPLIITVTPETEASVLAINDVMRGHGQLRRLKFTDTVREISGDLTAKELLTFFARIEQAGKVSYSRKRLDSFPTAQPVPFVMKMKQAPKIAQPSATPAVDSTPPAPAPSAMPVSAPTTSTP
ncbi:MAG: hypothetical protein A2078_01070 [Nitrospirae bacterium GWC2_57_9]|nr:MAG: hypothetical protein A2078_01070 [Nitrospirae bacterium GWC2_57_9]